MEQGNVFRQKSLVNNFETVIVSIPLEQGNVFRPLSSTFNAGITIVSIPLEQGNVFRPNAGTLLFTTFFVSIPLEQGNVFRQSEDSAIKSRDLSQSLWNRAMSFDCSGMLEAGVMRPFRPTSQFFGKVKELALNLSK